MMPKPVQEASPPNAWALTFCVTPGTLTSSIHRHLVPRARLGAQRGGHRRVLGRVWSLLAGLPGPNCWICTGTAAERV